MKPTIRKELIGEGMKVYRISDGDPEQFVRDIMQVVVDGITDELFGINFRIPIEEE